MRTEHHENECYTRSIERLKIRDYLPPCFESIAGLALSL